MGLDSLLTTACAAVLGTALLAAGLGKMLGPRVPPERAIEYILLPHQLARACVAALPWVEAGAGAILLVQPFLPGDLSPGQLIFALATVLLVAYSIAAGYALARRLDIDCNCFGRFGGGRVSRGTIWRNVLLVGCAALGWHAASGRSAPVSLGTALAITVCAVSLLQATVLAWSAIGVLSRAGHASARLGPQGAKERVNA